MTTALVTQALWEDLQRDLQSSFSRHQYETWFAPLQFQQQEDDTIIIQAPTEFAAIFLEDNYADLLRERLSTLAEVALDIEIQAAVQEVSTQADEPEVAMPGNPVARFETTQTPFDRSSLQRHRQARSDANKRKVFLNPRNTFENFIIGSSNQLAHAAALAVAAEPGKAYNPLFIYGETGLGKTHLMQAMAHSIQMNDPDAVVVYLSCEKFTNKFLKAIRENTLDEFRRVYRKVDVLLIDDVQFLQGKERTQEEFFHTFNELFESQRQVCLSSDRPASEMQGLESRLVSRFQWGMVTDIQAPDLETRTAILRKKALSLGHGEIPERVLTFLAQNITRNVRRLEGALLKVAAYTRLHGNEVSDSRLQELVHDILAQESSRVVTIDGIQRLVTESYQLKMSDMVSKRRPNHIAFPRQIAMYLSRILTHHPLKEIGEAFGGRDHGTVIHACKTVEAMMEQDAKVKDRVENLRKKLAGEVVA